MIPTKKLNCNSDALKPYGLVPFSEEKMEKASVVLIPTEVSGWRSLDIGFAKQKFLRRKCLFFGSFLWTSKEMNITN